jgi:membrane protein YqaA with SNARE-associated domain
MQPPSPSADRLRRWVRRLNASPHLLWLLTVFSFLETIVIPIPIELVLIPVMVANRRRVWVLATVTTVGCLLAALLGYGVGLALYESVGRWFIDTMGYAQAYESFQQFFASHGFVAILLVGVLPIPFQVAMITAGLSGYPLHLFVLAAVIARGIRYYGLAWLVLRFGPRARELWRRHGLATSLTAGAVLLGLYAASRYLADRLL